MEVTTRHILTGVREYGEGYPVELVCHPEAAGRLCIRAKNEGGNNDTLVDLWDLIDWLRSSPEFDWTDNGLRLLTGTEG